MRERKAVEGEGEGDGEGEGEGEGRRLREGEECVVRRRTSFTIKIDVV